MTHVPPPNGTTAAWCSTASASTAATSSWLARPDDGVGRVGQVARAGAQQVGRGLAAGAVPAQVVVGADVRLADRVGERRQERRRAAPAAGRAAGHRLGRGGRTEHGLHQRPGALGEGGGCVRVSPALGVHLSGHALQCDTCRHFVTSVDPSPPLRDLYLDAARDCILDVGWRRTTLTEVARRAGVSRMTIYRSWSDMPQLLGDLMTREWGGVVAVAASGPEESGTVERIVGTATRAIRALRENELFVRIVELDPQLLLPYLLSRRGRSQQAILDLVADQLRAGQATGEVRDTDPDVARAGAAAGHPRVRAVGAHDGRRPRLRGRPRCRAGRDPDEGGPAVIIRSPARPTCPSASTSWSSASA